MIWDEEALKRLYKENIDSLAAAAQGRCPSFSDLAHSFSGRVTRRSKRKIVDHVTRCPSCFKEFSFLAQLHRKEKELAEKAADWASSRKAGLHSGKRPFPLLYEYASGALILIFLFTSLFFIISSFHRPNVRGATSHYIAVFSPSGLTRSNNPIVFSWKHIGISCLYTVELYDDALRLIWKSAETSRTYLPAPSLPRDLPGIGKKYFWSVTGFSKANIYYYSALKAFSLKS